MRINASEVSLENSQTPRMKRAHDKFKDRNNQLVKESGSHSTFQMQHLTVERRGCSPGPLPAQDVIPFQDGAKGDCAVLQGG